MAHYFRFPAEHEIRAKRVTCVNQGERTSQQRWGDYFFLYPFGEINSRELFEILRGFQVLLARNPGRSNKDTAFIFLFLTSLSLY